MPGDAYENESSEMGAEVERPRVQADSERGGIMERITQRITRRITQRMLSGVVFGALIAVLAALPVRAEQPGDMWITTRVKMQLLTDDTVDGLDVNVDTFDGRVTLHGKVASEAAKRRAGERTREVEGVADVRNLLVVVPEAGRDEVEISDEKLEQRVSTVLERDQALEDSDIEIDSVHDGVVLLSGKAKTLSAHRRALEDARSVDGVRRVASQIQSPDELSDEELWQEGESRAAAQGIGGNASDVWITTKVKTLLLTEAGLSPMAINVDTYRGVVTLFGSVETKDVKTRAADLVSAIDGVKGVENELQIAPPDVAAQRVETRAEELKALVQERISSRDALDDADIDVQVENRVVRLTGTVASQSDRMTALTLARSAKGVDSVIDDLRVDKGESRPAAGR